jgi:hypothetical protein
MTSSNNWAIFIAIEASLTQALLPERHELGSRTGHMQLEPIIRKYGVGRMSLLYAYFYSSVINSIVPVPSLRLSPGHAVFFESSFTMVVF